jgi:hypothetical protein
MFWRSEDGQALRPGLGNAGPESPCLIPHPVVRSSADHPVVPIGPPAGRRAQRRARRATSPRAGAPCP